MTSFLQLCTVAEDQRSQDQNDTGNHAWEVADVVALLRTQTRHDDGSDHD